MNLLTALVGAIGCFWASLKVFAWFEDALAPQRKEEITQLLKSADAFAENKVLTLSMEQFHNGLFGNNQFSVKCIIRTFVFSILSFSLTIFALLMSELSSVLNDTFWLRGQWTTFILLMFAVAVPIDFSGVYTTRRFIKWLGGGVTLKSAAGAFLLEIIVKATMIPIIIEIIWVG